jgi:SRSO17 transposase
MNEKQLQAASGRLERFMTELLAGIGRSDRRQQGARYIQGLLLDGERKSIEPLAARVPGGNVQALQQFVGQSPWGWEPVREQLAQRMQEALLPTAGWIIDDTGFPKQGKDSVGVARQYSGTLGKVGNCQIAVSIHLTTAEESTPLDWVLYLPREWIDDPERCLKAGVPENTVFRTKPELALALIDQLGRWGLTQLPVLADAAYGRSTEFRQGLVDRQLQYVVGIEPDTAIWTEPTRRVQPVRKPGKAARRFRTIGQAHFAGGDGACPQGNGRPCAGEKAARGRNKAASRPAGYNRLMVTFTTRPNWKRFGF